jgi:SAM-dependent methyltransferase
MRFRDDTLTAYISSTPLALALERSVESKLYRGRDFERPILDIGCGDGLFAAFTFADAVDVGIDPNERELDEARATGAYEELIQCEGSRIPFPADTFGTVFSNSVLEHIPDVAAVFREVHRVLRPGGHFYFTVPSSRFYEFSLIGSALSILRARRWKIRYRREYNRFWRHFHDFSPELWAELARDTGFEVVEVFSYNPAKNCRFNDALVPLGAMGKANKALTNRWVLAPVMRARLAPRLGLAVERLLQDADEPCEGGLVFCSATKPLAR